MHDTHSAPTRLIDSHAHVWDRNCQLVSNARYRPDYEATIDTYLGVLDAHGIRRAVLVQPSFLGTDNSYLLAALKAHPDRLRGIVVLDPSVSDAELDDLTAAGVIGHRYNLLSLAPERLAEPAYRALTQRLSERLWWTEIQAPGTVWPEIAKLMIEDLAHVMVDHFGLPSGPDCPGIAAIAEIEPALLCLKLSAPYRQSGKHYAEAIRPILCRKKPGQLLWGSDWPWTQHEARHLYRHSIDWLDDWLDTEQRAMMTFAAQALGFV